MIDEKKLAGFLEQHKRNAENFNSEGNYDPNPYWLAEDIIKLFTDMDNKYMLPRPLESWEAAQKLDCSDYVEWHLKQEKRNFI